jgi:hypothetical protein
MKLHFTDTTKIDECAKTPDAVLTRMCMDMTVKCLEQNHDGQMPEPESTVRQMFEPEHTKDN